MAKTISFAALSAASQEAKDQPSASFLQHGTLEHKFEQIISNPIALEFFKAFCALDGSLNILLFLLDVAWLEAVERQSRPGDQEILQAVAHIRLLYLSRSKAKHPIPVSEGVRKRANKAASASSTVFAPAVAEVTKIILAETLPKFLSSVASEALQMAVDVYGENSASTSRSADASETRRKPMVAFRSTVIEKLRELGQHVIGGPDELEAAGLRVSASDAAGDSPSSSSSSPPPSLSPSTEQPSTPTEVKEEDAPRSRKGSARLPRFRGSLQGKKMAAKYSTVKSPSVSPAASTSAPATAGEVVAVAATTTI
jgi:hypothetical protein